MPQLPAIDWGKFNSIWLKINNSSTKYLDKNTNHWARPGFEPGTSRTLSENHTPRPTSRWWREVSGWWGCCLVWPWHMCGPVAVWRHYSATDWFSIFTEFSLNFYVFYKDGQSRLYWYEHFGLLLVFFIFCKKNSVCRQRHIFIDST